MRISKRILSQDRVSRQTVASQFATLTVSFNVKADCRAATTRHTACAARTPSGRGYAAHCGLARQPFRRHLWTSTTCIRE